MTGYFSTQHTNVDRMIRAKQVADMFGVDCKSIRRWALEGKIPFVLTPGGHRRYSENAIRALIEDSFSPVKPNEPTES